MRTRRTTLRERQDELRRRFETEKESRKAWLGRLRDGTASYEDLLRAVREGRFRTRQEAQRAWGLLG